MARDHGYGAVTANEIRHLSNHADGTQRRQLFLRIAAAVLCVSAVVCLQDVFERHQTETVLNGAESRKLRGQFELATKLTTESSVLAYNKILLSRLQENTTAVEGENGTETSGNQSTGNSTDGNGTDASNSSSSQDGNALCKPGEAEGRLFGVSMKCWLSLYHDPEDIEDFLRQHKVLSAEMWYGEHKNFSVNTDDWYDENKDFGDFDMQDWLDAHGLKREEKAIHGRLELLSALDHMLADKGDAYVRCGLECWLEQFRDPEDIEEWYQARKGNVSMEAWYQAHKAMLPRTEEWYQEHKNQLQRTEEWYQEHKAMLPRAEEWYQEHKNMLPRTEEWYQEHKNMLPRTEEWYQAHKDQLQRTEEWYQEHKGMLPRMEAWYQEHKDMLPPMEAWYQAHKGMLPRAEVWYQEHKNMLPRTEAWYQEHKGFGNFSVSAWKAAHGVHPVDVADDVRGAILWELMTALDANGGDAEEAEEEAPADADDNATDAKFNMHEWLNAHPNFDLKQWLNKTDSGFDLDQWLLENELAFDLSEWLNATGSDFNLNQWLNETDNGFDLDTWMNESKIVTGTTDEFLNKTPSFDLSKWLDAQIDFDMEAWIAKQQVQAADQTSEDANSTEFDLDAWLQAQEEHDMHAWLDKQADFNLSDWLNQFPDDDDGEFKGNRKAALQIGRVAMLAEQANKTKKPFSLSDWLKAHKDSTEYATFNLSAWLDNHTVPELKSTPPFNLSAWLDKQPKGVVDKWLASLARGEGAEGSGPGWYRFAPEEEAVNMTAPGMCCCGFACEQISFDCCGPWYPMQEKGRQTALRQKRLQELAQVATAYDYKAQQLALVKARVKATQAATKTTLMQKPKQRARAPSKSSPSSASSVVHSAARKPLAPIHTPTSRFTQSRKPAASAHMSLSSHLAALHAEEAKKDEWQCLAGCSPSPLRVGASCDVECASADGVNCIKPSDCTAEAAALSSDVKMVVCGAAMEASWGTTGYDDPSHWCYCGKQSLAEEMRQCEARAASPAGSNSVFGSGVQFGPSIAFASGDTFGDDNEFGAGDSFGDGDTFGSHNAFVDAKFGDGAAFDSENQFEGKTEFGADAKFNHSNVFGEGTVFGARAALLGSKNEVGAGSVLGDGARVEGDDNVLGDQVTIGSDSKLGAGTVVGSESKFGSNVVLGAGVRVGGGSTFLGPADVAAAEMATQPTEEGDQYYRPDPGSPFARKGPTKVDTRLEGKNYWPEFVDQEEEPEVEEGGGEGEGAEDSEAQGAGEEDAPGEEGSAEK